MVSREQWLRTREKLPLMQGSQKGGARYTNNCRKSLQAWRCDLKELVPELLRARGYCRPEIVKRVLLY